MRAAVPDNASESSLSEEDFEEMVAAGMIGRNHGSGVASSSSSSSKAASSSSSSSSSGNINNILGLKRAFDAIKQDLPWIERLEVVSAEPLGVTNVKDDLKLETAL
jgi:hypothetical protein